MSNAGWEPQHFTILTIDIEGFGSTTRTDPIRAGLRRALKALVSSALSSIDANQFMQDSGNTGDGMWIIFSPALPKTRILDSLVRNIEAHLRHHNEAASTAARLRLRMGIHHGDLIRDDEGHSGEALNYAFRIIDNDVARNALRATPGNAILIVSGDFFDKIVKPGFGSIDPGEFSPLHVRNKETDTVVWLNAREIPAEIARTPGASSAQAFLSLDRSSRQVLAIGDLAPTSLYVPITDIHNMRLYARSFPEAPVRLHLEAALLLAEKVVVHCADPYRSKVVADALSDLSPCIESGDLLFLLGENAQDPRSHLRGYIDYKVEQYGKSRYGQRDRDSLTDIDADAPDRTEELLNLSPFALIRGFSGSDGFIRCARRDLQAGELIAIREHYTSSLVSRLNLTTRQLLDLTQVEPNGELRRIVADERAVGVLQLEIDRLASHNSFSRQIFLEAIRQGTNLNYEHPLDEAFEERVSVVHLKGTLGSLSHLELTNRRDRLSPYYYGHLIEHLSSLAEVPYPKNFGHSLVLELRALPVWWLFAWYHLRLVAGAVHKQTWSERLGDLSTSYGWSRKISDFESVRSIVREHWA